MTAEKRLNDAANTGEVDDIYAKLEEHPDVLERIDSIPFVQTPLHVAVNAENLQFATEIMRLKPSFAWKLNPRGSTPIHLALLKSQNKMVIHFVNINKDLVRVKGREGLTILHIIVSLVGDVELLRKLLKACPDSINDVTVKSETALHLAIKFQRLEAFKFFVRWLESESVNLEVTMLNWKNEDGNTILHIAAIDDNIEIIKWLTKRMDINATNLEGKTALELVSPDLRRHLQPNSTIFFTRKIHSLISLMAEWVVRKFRLRRHMLEEERNAYLVIATLVATATYQAALSPPSGLYQTDGTKHTGVEGNSIMTNVDFVFFSITNMCCFMASTIAMFALLPRRNTAWLLFDSPVLFLQFSYLHAMCVISPTHLTTILVASIFGLFDIIFFLWLWASFFLN